MRNMGLSLVAVFAIAVTLLFLTFAIVARDFTEAVTSDVKEKVTMSVYFKEGVDEETILGVKEEIQTLPDIREIEYISKQRALESFIERHKDNPVLMAALAEVGNPFLSSLSINAESAGGYEMAVAFLEDSPSRVFFEKIDYDARKSIIEDIFNFTSTVQKTGMVIAIIMGLIAVLVVFNIVRLAIYGMKEEISIMRLVGVSRKFIASSFIFQGAITGIVGVLASLIVIVVSVLMFGERIAELIPGLDIAAYLATNYLYLFAVQFGTALVLGISSSLVAIAKYLRI